MLAEKKRETKVNKARNMCADHHRIRMYYVVCAHRASSELNNSKLWQCKRKSSTCEPITDSERANSSLIFSVDVINDLHLYYIGFSEPIEKYSFAKKHMSKQRARDRVYVCMYTSERSLLFRSTHLIHDVVHCGVFVFTHDDDGRKKTHTKTTVADVPKRQRAIL